MAQKYPSGARPKLPVQRPLSAYRLSEDERLARKLHEEEESLALDELLAQELQEQLNITDNQNRAVADKLQKDYSHYHGMTVVDGMLAKQLQMEEEKQQKKKQPPRQPEGELEDDLFQLPSLMSSLTIPRQTDRTAPSVRSSTRQPMQSSLTQGSSTAGRPRRLGLVMSRSRRQPNAENLPDGETDPEQLLMTYGVPDFLSFLNVMRDPNLLLTMMAPHLAQINEANVDLNDYDALWELTERLGEVKHKGMTSEGISALPTRHYQPNGPQNLDCQICLAKFEAGDELRRLPCAHEYHAACIDEWLKRNATCPVCRKNISDN